MQISKRQIALSSILALLLYLVPNLVQDIHRIWGHRLLFEEIHTQTGLLLYSQNEKCPVCVFEFNVADETDNFVYVPLIHTVHFVFGALREHQIQNKTFQYYNLRAPPEAPLFHNS